MSLTWGCVRHDGRCASPHRTGVVGLVGTFSVAEAGGASLVSVDPLFLVIPTRGSPRKFHPAMFRLGAALAVLGVLAGPVRADEAAKQNLVIEMFKVMKYDQMINKIADSVASHIIDSIKKKYPNVEEGVASAIREIAREEFSALGPDMAKFTAGIMLRYYSEEDLRVMLAFYRTKTGQKSIAVMPLIFGDMMAWVRPLAKESTARITANLKKRLREKGYRL